MAKHGYVAANTGWFSERSACYLASGQPVVVEDTGFSDLLPIGAGTFAFTTPDEAVEHLASMNRDYERHCRSARDVASEVFRRAQGVEAPARSRAVNQSSGSGSRYPARFLDQEHDPQFVRVLRALVLDPFELRVGDPPAVRSSSRHAGRMRTRCHRPGAGCSRARLGRRIIREPLVLGQRIA